MPDTHPPLVLDIDGTLTRPDRGLDPRVFDPVREWPAPVVLATGKAFPYPIALCDFLGIDHRVVAENGGVVCADDEVWIHDDGDDARALVARFQETGGDLGWGDVDLVNRWRESEVAIRRDRDETQLRELAAEFDLEFVDTGYAFHVKPRGLAKGDGVRTLADLLDRDPGEFVAVGDSENDVSTFAVVDRSFAVANADDAAKAAATETLDDAHATGTLSVLRRFDDGTVFDD